MVERRRLVLTLLVLSGVGLAGGCKPIDLSPSHDWFSKADDDPKVPISITAVWSPAMLERSDGSRARGFGGRLMFNGAKSQTPVRVDGAVIIYAYDEEDRGASESRPSRKYVFTREQFATHYSKSDLGHSYSLWIPWDQVGGTTRQVSLIVRFTPVDGSTIVSEVARVTLPGNAPLIEQQVQVASQPTNAAAARFVPPASQTRPDAADPKPGSEAAARRMATTTIRIPPRGESPPSDR